MGYYDQYIITKKDMNTSRGYYICDNEKIIFYVLVKKNVYIYSPKKQKLVMTINGPICIVVNFDYCQSMIIETNDEYIYLGDMSHV